MFTDDFGEVVTKRVGWIGIVPRNVSSIFFQSAVRRDTVLVTITGQFDAGKLVSEVWKQTGHGHARGSGHRPRASVRQSDVIRGVAGDKLVQQRRADGRGQTCQGAGAGTDEVGLNRGEAAPIRARPQGGWSYRIPRIVDVTKRRAKIGIEVVIYTDQFLAPLSRIWRRRVK